MTRKDHDQLMQNVIRRWRNRCQNLVRKIDSLEKKINHAKLEKQVRPALKEPAKLTDRKEFDGLTARLRKQNK